MHATGVTTDMLVVFFLLGFAIFLFVTDLLRVDLVGLMIMVLLPLTGVISADEAMAGLSSNAVVSVMAIMIIGAGLNRTGVMNLVAAKIIRVVGRSERRMIAFISLTVAVMSSFMQSIGAVALFMPASMRISRQLNISPTKILMPMGFCAIVGGCLTLVGSSSLIMLNDLAKSWWLNNAAAVHNQPYVPFKLLSTASTGIFLLLAAIAYFFLLGKRILPADACSLDDDCMDKRLQGIYGAEVGRSYELSVPAGYPARSLGQLEVRPKYHVTVVGLAKNDGYSKDLAPVRDSLVEAGDSLWVMGSDKNTRRLAGEQGWLIKPEHQVFASENLPEESGIIEGVIIPHSNLSSHTMEELKFRSLFQINPLAIVRGDRIIIEGINVTQLQQGDTILMQGRWKQFRLLKDKLDIALLHDIHGEEVQPERTRAAVFFLVMALTLALVFQVRLSIALLSGALGMILTGIIPADRAYEAIDWRLVFRIAGMVPLGTAFETTGAADYLTQKVLMPFGAPEPLLFMAIISLLTAFFSLIASNIGATVLMLPIAMNMAVSIGADPKLAALVVAISASNTFVLPTNQVNAVVMRPGGYRTRDYLRAGSGMTILYVAVLIICVKLFFAV